MIRKIPSGLLLTLPFFVWMLFFLVIPMGMILVYGFLTRGAYGELTWKISFDNYARIFDPLYLEVFFKSAILAFATTTVCLLLGWPTAYVIATARKGWRGPLFALVMVPFLTNFIVRVYAVRILLGVEGPINWVFLKMGWILEPLVVTDSVLAVALGMVTNYLPFMILPIYVVLEKLDFSLVEAARNLGASSFSAFYRILWPLSKVGVISGSVLVFVPVLGEFMVPDLLGGARTMLLGGLITEQFLKARNWPFGAALVTVLLVASFVMLALEIAFRKHMQAPQSEGEARHV